MTPLTAPNLSSLKSDWRRLSIPSSPGSDAVTMTLPLVREQNRRRLYFGWMFDGTATEMDATVEINFIYAGNIVWTWKHHFRDNGGVDLYGDVGPCHVVWQNHANTPVPSFAFDGYNGLQFQLADVVPGTDTGYVMILFPLELRVIAESCECKVNLISYTPTSNRYAKAAFAVYSEVPS